MPLPGFLSKKPQRSLRHLFFQHISSISLLVNNSSCEWTQRILDILTVHKGYSLHGTVFFNCRITVNLGDDIATPRGHLVLENNLADNRWHTVKVILVGKLLNVSVHGQTFHAVLQSKYARFDVDGFVYAGGVPQRTLHILQEYKPSSNLKGCLRDVFFDRVQVLVGPAHPDINYREYGSPEHICRHVKFTTLSFQYPEAYLYMPSIGKDLFSVQMWFRTYFANGILAFKGVLNVRYVSVSLIEGKVVLKVQVSRDSPVIQFGQGKSLNDGKWHYLSVVVSKTGMKLKLDQLPELPHENPSLKQVELFSENLYIGYYPNSPNFIGCIHGLYVDDRVVQLNGISWAFMFGKLSSSNRCNISSNCFPNPCQHCGKCNEVRSGGFSCNCQSTFHRGPLCERPIYLRTCQEYKNLGLADDAYCKVDPDAEGPIGPLKVLCNVSADQKQAVTLINHNKVGPQLVSSGADYVNPSVYIHRIQYPADLDEIKALIARSDRCRQFVSFKCFGSKLLQSPMGPVQVLWQTGGMGLVTDHWPGAPAGSRKCACGVNGTCADPRLSCNCDIGDQTWREDKGKAYFLPRIPNKKWFSIFCKKIMHA